MRLGSGKNNQAYFFPLRSTFAIFVCRIIIYAYFSETICGNLGYCRNVGGNDVLRW